MHVKLICLCCRLLSKQKDKRLCTASEIKSHSFFKDIDWDTLRTKGTPPFIPTIVSPDDVTFFSATEEDEEEESDDDYSFIDEQDDTFDMYKEYPFVGYTYTQDNAPQPKPVSAHQEFISQYRQKLNMNTEDVELKQELAKLKEDNQRLLKENQQLQTETQRLQGENHLVTKENQELHKEKQLLEKDSQQLLKENQLLEKDNRQLLDKNEELKLRIDRLEDTISKEKQDLQHQSKREILVISKENDTLKHQIDQLMKENQDLRQETSKTKDLQEQINQSKKEYQTTLEENQSIKQQLEAETHQHQSIIEENEHLIQGLRHQLKSAQENELAAKNQVHSKQSLLEKLEADFLNLQKMKRSTKSLPAIPSPGEGRSILSAMWQRDKESLKHVQQALEASESQLAFAKKQVLKLKREIKCLQQYTFQQQKLDMSFR